MTTVPDPAPSPDGATSSDWPPGSETHDAPTHITRYRLDPQRAWRLLTAERDALAAACDALDTELLGVRDALRREQQETARLRRELHLFELGDTYASLRLQAEATKSGRYRL